MDVAWKFAFKTGIRAALTFELRAMQGFGFGAALTFDLGAVQGFDLGVVFNVSLMQGFKVASMMQVFNVVSMMSVVQAVEVGIAQADGWVDVPRIAVPAGATR